MRRATIAPGVWGPEFLALSQIATSPAHSHALERLWACRPPKLLSEEYAAGTTLRALWAKAGAGGRLRWGADSTRRERVDGARALPESDCLSAMQAQLALERIRLALHADNWCICENFLAADMGVAESVQRVVPCHPDGTLYRLREALKRAGEAIEAAMRKT
jgi:hypothetical protein